MSPDRRAADRLNDCLDAMAAGAAQPCGFDRAVGATAERFFAADDAPPPPPGLADRIWDDLTAPTATGPLAPHPPVAPPGRNGHRLGHDAPSMLPRRSPTVRRWALGYLATAALVALVLLGSVLLLVPGRLAPQRPNVAPAIVPAPISEDEPLAAPLWQSRGGPGLPFGEPAAPAVDPEGNVWVPDAAYDQFLIFAPDATFLESWGAPGNGDGEFRFANPRAQGNHNGGGVAFDQAGNIYVADTGNVRIQKFGPDRAFITSWGSEGAGAGQFRRPVDVAVDGQGRVYVSDEDRDAIEVFTSDGEWLASWPTSGAPAGIAAAPASGNPLDPNGAAVLWVAQSDGVLAFSAAGERLATWGAAGEDNEAFRNPLDVAVDEAGRVFVAEHDADLVRVLAPDGTVLGALGQPGAEPGKFQTPRGIALDGEGHAYVVEDGANRLQKLQLLPPLAPAGTEPDVPASAGEPTPQEPWSDGWGSGDQTP
jgi:sugar lactone lactonase YvrE